MALASPRIRRSGGRGTFEGQAYKEFRGRIVRHFLITLQLLKRIFHKFFSEINERQNTGPLQMRKREMGDNKKYTE